MLAAWVSHAGLDFCAVASKVALAFMAVVIQAAALSLVWVAFVPSGPAEQDPRYKTVVRHKASSKTHDQQLRQAQVWRATPGFASAIELQDEKAVHPAQLGARLRQSAGATLRSLGGLGQFSALSLRGSSVQQVRTFLDGVPVDGAFSGIANLSQSSTDSLSHVQVFRGYVPIMYGSATMGGAVALHSRRYESGQPRMLRGSLGIGSFGARALSLQGSSPLGSMQGLSWTLSLQGSDGDFRYFDNGGTPYNPSDDRHVLRQNNGFSRLSSHLGFVRRGRFEQRFNLRSRLDHVQVPGSSARQSSAAFARSSTHRISHQASRELRVPGTWMRSASAVSHQWRRYEDPLGEVGLGRDDEREHTLDLYTRLTLRVALWNMSFLKVSADERLEWVRVDSGRERPVNPVRPVPQNADRIRNSAGLGLGLEQYLAKGLVLILPAMRVDAVTSRFALSAAHEEGLDADQRGASNDHLWGWSARLGAKAQLWPWLELRASAGRYLRMPNLMELFGDRGFMVGNPSLVQEQGYNTDAGLVLRHAGRWGLQASVAGFAAWPEDLISWQRAGVRVRAVNLDRAKILGVESQLDLRVWRFALVGAYTLTHTENQSKAPAQAGRALPGRPRHQAHTSLSYEQGLGRSGQHALGVSGELEFVSGNALDPSERYKLPARQLVTASAFVQLDPWRLSCSLRNLLDVRTATLHPSAGTQGSFSAPVSDFMGYPLPGRSLWCSMRVALAP